MNNIEKLNMIVDVRTYWNSTIKMLKHAQRVKSQVLDWVRLEGHREFTVLLPSLEEWSQIRYVIKILYLFYYYISLLSTTSSFTVDKA